MIRFFAIISILFIGVSCSTTDLKRQQCADVDWFEYGRRDGASGRSWQAFKRREATCVQYGIQPSEEDYRNGRNAGLVDYCQRENGYALGRAGESYRAICPPSIQSSFKKGFEIGQRVFELEKDNLKLEERIGDIFSRLGQASLSPKEAGNLRSELTNLQKRREKIIARLNELESQLAQN